jgi:hypothetical protein
MPSLCVEKQLPFSFTEESMDYIVVQNILNKFQLRIHSDLYICVPAYAVALLYVSNNFLGLLFINILFGVMLHFPL